MDEKTLEVEWEAEDASWWAEWEAEGKAAWRASEEADAWDAWEAIFGAKDIKETGNG